MNIYTTAAIFYVAALSCTTVLVLHNHPYFAIAILILTAGASFKSAK